MIERENNRENSEKYKEKKREETRSKWRKRGKQRVEQRRGSNSPVISYRKTLQTHLIKIQLAPLSHCYHSVLKLRLGHNNPVDCTGQTIAKNSDLRSNIHPLPELVATTIPQNWFIYASNSMRFFWNITTIDRLFFSS